MAAKRLKMRKTKELLRLVAVDSLIPLGSCVGTGSLSRLFRPGSRRLWLSGLPKCEIYRSSSSPSESSFKSSTVSGLAIRYSSPSHFPRSTILQRSEQKGP